MSDNPEYKLVRFWDDGSFPIRLSEELSEDLGRMTPDEYINTLRDFYNWTQLDERAVLSPTGNLLVIVLELRRTT